MNADIIGGLLSSAVRNAVSGKDTAVSFSGGIDSGLIAAMATEYTENVRLYTVGTEGAHDVLKAEEAAKLLDLEQEHILLTEDNIEGLLKEMIHISGTEDPLTLSFEIPTFCVTKFCSEHSIIGGIGADELFGGYHRYIGMPPSEFKDARNEDLKKLMSYVIPHEDKVADYFGKTIHRPFVDRDLVDAVLSLPCEEILPSDKRPRKAILKEIAESMNLNLLAETEKKAAQYGSGAMGLIRKSARKEKLTVGEYVKSFSDR